MAVIVVVIDLATFGTVRENSGIISLLFAAQVRRLHDIDWSGWAMLINPVPFGSAVVLVLACLAGTNGVNRFGANAGGKIYELTHGATPGRPRVPTVREPAFTNPYVPASDDLDPANYPGSAMSTNAVASALSRQGIPTADPDPIADVERLAKLRDSGSITDDEFRAMKARILAEN